MKTKKVLLSMAIAALFMTGCSKENDSPIEDGSSNYVSINASIGQFLTKSPTATAFTSGDNIAVYAWTGSKTEITPETTKKDYSFDEADWAVITAPGISFKDLTTDYYFMGRYPTTPEISSFTADNYTLDPTKQEQSDILVATSTNDDINGANAATAVSLGFTHIMAKLTINLSYGTDDFASTPTVTAVTVNAKSTATIDYLTKAVTESSTETAADITMPVVTANQVYSSIMIPQNIGDIIITIDGETNKYKLADPDIDLTSGVNQILNLTVGKDGLVTLTSTGIADWTDATGTGTAVEVTGA